MKGYGVWGCDMKYDKKGYFVLGNGATGEYC